MEHQAIMKGDPLHRLCSTGFITGALLWVTTSLLGFGIVSAGSNMAEMLKGVGERVVFAQGVEILYVLSMLAVMTGMAGFYRSITANGAAWARVGFYLIVVGTVLWIVGYALDMAVASAAAKWLAAPAASKEAAYNVVAALSAISRGTFPISVIVYWAAFVFLGVGMVRSAVYPRWLGWFGLILGVAGVPLGIVQTFNGRESTFNLFMVLYPFTMLWFFVVGTWVARKAWQRTIKEKEKESAMTRQSIMTEDGLQKLNSAGFVTGAILMVIGNLLMPYTTNPTGDLQEMLKPLGEQEFRSEASSLLIAVGFWAIMIGATGLYRSITGDGAPWARAGFYLLLVGTTLQTITLSLDVATAGAVAKWLAAPVGGKEAAWSVVVALNAVGRGVVPITWVVFWLGFAFLAIGMIGSVLYPRWLGWVGLILSIPVVAVGTIQVFNERSTTLTLVFVVLALLTNLWALSVGIWMARTAWGRATIRSAPYPA